MDQQDLKTNAELWRRWLLVGLRTLEAVRAWADERIAELETPPPWLIAASSAARMEDALSALGNAEGDADTTAVWSALMREWKELLDRDPERDSEIARYLFYLAMDGDAPGPGAQGQMMSFWDSIDLARDAFYGVREAERDKLRNFLSRWSSAERD